MDHLDALKMALNKENRSVEMYKKLSVQHPAMRDLFESLLNEEEKHVVLIKKRMAELYR